MQSARLIVLKMRSIIPLTIVHVALFSSNVTFTMNYLVFEDVANTFAKLRMFPYFDICHYVLMSIAVKEDVPQSVRLLICTLKEIQRAKKIFLGVEHGLHTYPESVVMCILMGLLKASGYCEMKFLQRLVRGVWLPASTEFLHPSFTTKISFLSAVAFYCHHLGLIPMPVNQLFLIIAALLVYLRVTMILLGLKDPFSPFENIACTVVFGGFVDALKRAFDKSRQSSTADTASTPSSPSTPSAPHFAGQTMPQSPTNSSMGPSMSNGQANTANTPSGVRSADTGWRQSSPPSDKKRD